MVAIKRAKAVAAHAKLEFEEQSSTIKKKQAQLDEQENLAKATVVRKRAELEADLQFLTRKSEAAAAEAHALKALEFEEGNLSDSSLFGKAEGLNSVDAMARTQQYVKQQTKYNASQHVQNVAIKTEHGDQSFTPMQFPNSKPPFESQAFTHYILSPNSRAEERNDTETF